MFTIKQQPKDISYIPEHIKRQYERWNSAESLIPEYDYMKGYKSRTATARKLWKQFSALCKEKNIHPVKVAHDLNSQKPL